MKYVWILDSGCIYEGGSVDNAFGTKEEGTKAAVKLIQEDDWYNYKLEENRSSDVDTIWHGYTREDDELGEPFAIMYIGLKRYEVK